MKGIIFTLFGICVLFAGCSISSRHPELWQPYTGGATISEVERHLGQPCEIRDTEPPSTTKIHIYDFVQGRRPGKGDSLTPVLGFGIGGAYVKQFICYWVRSGKVVKITQYLTTGEHEIIWDSSSSH